MRVPPPEGATPSVKAKPCGMTERASRSGGEARRGLAAQQRRHRGRCLSCRLTNRRDRICAPHMQDDDEDEGVHAERARRGGHSASPSCSVTVRACVLTSSPSPADSRRVVPQHVSPGVVASRVTLLS